MGQRGPSARGDGAVTTEQSTDEDPHVTGSEPRRLSWLYLFGILVNFLGNVGRVGVSLTDDVSLALARHDAWRQDQRAFRDSVRRDLESIDSIPADSTTAQESSQGTGGRGLAL